MSAEARDVHRDRAEEYRRSALAEGRNPARVEKEVRRLLQQASVTPPPAPLPIPWGLAQLLNEWNEVSTDRQWLAGMAGVYPLPIGARALDDGIRRMGCDGDDGDIARSVWRTVDAIDIERLRPKG